MIVQVDGFGNGGAVEVIFPHQVPTFVVDEVAGITASLERTLAERIQGVVGGPGTVGNAG